MVLGRVAVASRRGSCLDVFFWEYGPQRAWSLAIDILLMFPLSVCALSVDPARVRAWLVSDEWVVCSTFVGGAETCRHRL